MKFSNVSIGMKVEVKQNPSGFFDSNAGLIGTVIRLDKGKSLDVLLEFDNGSGDWGHTSSIRKTKQQPLFDKQDVDQMTSESTEGVTPRTIVHHTDFKVGDEVLVSNFTINAVSLRGKKAVVAKVEPYDYDGIINVKINSNGIVRWVKHTDLTLLTGDEVKEDTPQQETLKREITSHTDFKVGDKVLVSTNNWNGFTEAFHGVEAVVLVIEDAGYEGDYNILIDHNGECDWGHYEGLTLIEDGVVEDTVKQQEVEAGSRVKVKNNQNSFYSSREGKVGTVIIAINGFARVEFDGDDISNDSGRTSDLEIISDVSVEQNTKTPFTKLCEKVLQVSDMETLIKFINNVSKQHNGNLSVVTNLSSVISVFRWSDTEQGLEFWGDLDSKVSVSLNN